MDKKLSKNEARAFRERWRLVNSREEQELRTASPELKWQQFLTLLRWAREFGWTRSLSEGEAEVRQRWAMLRKAHLAKAIEIPEIRADLERRLSRPQARKRGRKDG